MGSGRMIDIGDAECWVEEHGTGAPVLLLHGGFQAGPLWSAVVPRLASRFHVVVPDARRHGRSTKSDGKLTYERLADDVATLIAALELERPLVVGWSDGGQVALELEIRHPGTARGLVIGGTMLDFGEPFQQAVREGFGLDEAGKVVPARLEAAFGAYFPFVRGMFAGDDDAWNAFTQATLDMWVTYAGPDRDALRAIRQPALVTLGDRDQFIAVESAVEMYRLLPFGELAVCPVAGHDLPENHPAWLAEMVTAFADRIAAAGPA